MELPKIQKAILTGLVEQSDKTNELNLKITKKELFKRLDVINHGYIEVLEYENEILERQGLIHGYFDKGKIMFSIPDWGSFISAINAFYTTCYAEDEDEDEDED